MHISSEADCKVDLDAPFRLRPQRLHCSAQAPLPQPDAHAHSHVPQPELGQIRTGVSIPAGWPAQSAPAVGDGHFVDAAIAVDHQPIGAKVPLHRNLAGFDFTSSKVDQPLVRHLATLAFTDTAQNVVLIGGPGTGKAHLATATAVSGIATKGKRVSALRRACRSSNP
jgi:hypothetical protein